MQTPERGTCGTRYPHVQTDFGERVPLSCTGPGSSRYAGASRVLGGREVLRVRRRRCRIRLAVRG